MTDLKELIEREIDQYLEWPTADKSHVTTSSAKLFAEHVATLYADHITDAGKMVAPAVRGEPVGFIRHVHYHGIARNSEECEVVLYDNAKNLPEGTLLYDAPPPAEQQPAPDVAHLMEALEDIAGTHHHSASAGEYFAKVARAALAKARGES